MTAMIIGMVIAVCLFYYLSNHCSDIGDQVSTLLFAEAEKTLLDDDLSKYMQTNIILSSTRCV